MKKLISWIRNLVGTPAGGETAPAPAGPAKAGPARGPTQDRRFGKREEGQGDGVGRPSHAGGRPAAEGGQRQGREFGGHGPGGGGKRKQRRGPKPEGGQRGREHRSDSEDREPRQPKQDRQPSGRGEGGRRPSWESRSGGRKSGGGFPGDPGMPDPDHWTADDDAVAIPHGYPFLELEISEPILKAVVAMGYEHPTPIQAEAIPEVMVGRDLVGASQTGTGKTAAFALPILTKLGGHGALRCLILEPTRELAAQVEEALIGFSRFMDIRITLLHGGVGYGTQTESLRRGVDIVVATPGRLLDHLERGTLRLDEIDFLVLDEVDRMLDMGFLPDVRRIIEQCKPERQTLFFSATMPPQIEALASFAVRNPLRIEIGQRFSPAETVSHAFYPVASDQRDDLLLALLKATDYHSVMIFTRTKAEADQVYALLHRDPAHKVTVLHSDIKQADRTRALLGFRQGEFDVIVATDVAARGLDITDVTHVINYRVPENPGDYVHRIGRTGRASKEGDAFTLLSGDEIDYAKAVERLIGQTIERKKLEGFAYLYTALLDDDLPKDKKAFRRALGHTGMGKGGKRKRSR